MPGAWLPAAAAEGHGSHVGPVTQRGQVHVDFHILLVVSNDDGLPHSGIFDSEKR